MRIRKNSKRVLVDGQSSSLLICQLNRSPWDIDYFFTQGEWDNDLPFNTSFSPASDSIESMELSFEYVGKTPSQSEREKDGSIEEIGSSNILPPQQIFSPAPLRPKKVSMPPIRASILPKKRGRPRKSTTGAVGATNNNNKKKNNSDNNNSENPYELYYYSGFGPRWNKQRGGSKSGLENGNDMETPGSSLTTRESSMSDYDDDENKNNKGDRDNDNDNDNGVMIQSFDSVLAAERELDYIGDEDEGDEDDLYTGKRARKPIKARSLKSLM